MMPPSIVSIMQYAINTVMSKYVLNFVIFIYFKFQEFTYCKYTMKVLANLLKSHNKYSLLKKSNDLLYCWLFRGVNRDLGFVLL